MWKARARAALKGVKPRALARGGSRDEQAQIVLSFVRLTFKACGMVSIMNLKPFSRGRLIIAFLMFSVPGMAAAAVEISFYSRELGGNNFPHAFATLKGIDNRTGEAVDMSYGFTAKTISPAILMGSVSGKVMNEPASYIAKSTRQFSVTLTDEQYQAVRSTIQKWETRKQPSYNLNKRNCVHFVGELAQASGLQVTFDPSLMKKPRSFLLSVKQANLAKLNLLPAAS